MRHLKSILLALFISIVLLAGGGMFLDSGYKVEKSILVKASPDKIFPYLEDLKKWPEWSIWSKDNDPSLILKYKGAESGVGAKQIWEGQTLEKGEIEITDLKANKEVFFKLSLKEGPASKGSLLLEPQSKNTKVTWKMEGEVGNNIPQRYFILFIDKLTGSDMEAGLSGLKKICEKE